MTSLKFPGPLPGYGPGRVFSAHLSAVYLLNKFPRSCTICRENGRPISVGIRIDYLDSLIQGIHGQNTENRAKYLFRVTGH